MKMVSPILKHSSLSGGLPIRPIMTIAILLFAYILFIGFISRWLQAASRPDREFMDADYVSPTTPCASESGLAATSGPANSESVDVSPVSDLISRKS